MAEYKEIRGTTIQNFTTDPGTSAEGQVWYDETARTVQYNIKNQSTAWRTSGNLNTGRFYFAGSGVQTSSIVTGGEIPAPRAIAESYNGTSWTEVADLNTAKEQVQVVLLL